MFSLFRRIRRKHRKPEENTDTLLTIVEPEETCVICLEDRSADQFTVRNACEHLKKCCISCIKSMMLLSDSIKEFSFDCWVCHDILDHTALKDIIPAKDFEEYDSKLLAHFLAKEEGYNTCLSRKCGLMFFTEGECAKPNGKCPYCKAKLCTQCFRLRKDHKKNEKCTVTEENKSKKLMAKLGVKTCPECSIQIEKFGGCSIMTCGMCYTHFCWTCRSKELWNDAVVHKESCPDASPAHNNAVRAAIERNALQQAHRTADENERVFDERYQRRNIARFLFRIEQSLRDVLTTHAQTANGQISSHELIASIGTEIETLSDEFEQRLQRWDLAFVEDRGVNEDLDFDARIQAAIDSMCENHAIGWSRGSDQSIRIELSWGTLEGWMEQEQGGFHARD